MPPIETLVKYAVAIVGWWLLYYVVFVRPRRKDIEAHMLADYDELMRKSGYVRSSIGKVAIWIPGPTSRPRKNENGN